MGKKTPTTSLLREFIRGAGTILLWLIGAIVLVTAASMQSGCTKKPEPASVSVPWNATPAPLQPSIPEWLRRSAVDSNGVVCYWRTSYEHQSLSCVKVTP